MANSMIDRLSAVTQLTQPQRPIQSSQIRTNYRNEFAQCLEPWIGKTAQSIPRSGPTTQEPLGSIDHFNAILLPQQPGLGIHAQQPSKRQQTVLRTKAMEGEGPFSNHCRSVCVTKTLHFFVLIQKKKNLKFFFYLKLYRSFDTQVKELSQQLSMVKERLNDLHRDVSLLRRVQTPPLINRYQRINGN